MAMPKKGTFWLVNDYRAVNKQIEQVPGVMPKPRGGHGSIAQSASFW